MFNNIFLIAIYVSFTSFGKTLNETQDTKPTSKDLSYEYERIKQLYYGSIIRIEKNTLSDYENYKCTLILTNPRECTDAEIFETGCYKYKKFVEPLKELQDDDMWTYRFFKSSDSKDSSGSSNEIFLKIWIETEGAYTTRYTEIDYGYCTK